METDTTPQLLSALRECGQYTPAQLAEAERTFAAGGDNAQLAGRLQAAGLLTAYQARKVKAGRTTEILFGPFLILDKIGEGGMGKVYKAAQQKSGRVVALKVVRPHLMANSTVISRYKREARAAASLNHPNVVSLYDADDYNGRYYLAMEYVDGIDLSKMMKEFGRPPTTGLSSYQEAAEYVRQAALGLQQPTNSGWSTATSSRRTCSSTATRALPGTRGKTGVKILDMGLVRSILDNDDGSGTRPHAATARWSARPTTWPPNRQRTRRRWTTGPTCTPSAARSSTCSTGQPPFPDGSPIDKLLRHQLDPPPDLRKSRPDVPEGLIEVIEKLLRKNADDRYQTAVEVAAARGPVRDQRADRHDGEIGDGEDLVRRRAVLVHVGPERDRPTPDRTRPRRSRRRDPDGRHSGGDDRQQAAAQAAEASAGARPRRDGGPSRGHHAEFGQHSHEPGRPHANPPDRGEHAGDAPPPGPPAAAGP